MLRLVTVRVTQFKVRSGLASGASSLISIFALFCSCFETHDGGISFTFCRDFNRLNSPQFRVKFLLIVLQNVHKTVQMSILG
jgi:hypothetical protein